MTQSQGVIQWLIEALLLVKGVYWLKPQPQCLNPESEAAWGKLRDKLRERLSCKLSNWNFQDFDPIVGNIYDFTNSLLKTMALTQHGLTTGVKNSGLLLLFIISYPKLAIFVMGNNKPILSWDVLMSHWIVRRKTDRK